MNRENEADIKVGTTCVAVFRRDIDDKGKETVNQIHEGIVLQDLSTHVRVFNPAPVDRGGDVSPETTEVFPLDGKNLWCEMRAPRKTPFPIPALFR